MSKICQLTGKRPSTGHNVSHSVRRTKRRFLPNLQIKRLIDPVTGQKVKIRMSTAALRTITKPATNRERRKAEASVAQQA